MIIDVNSILEDIKKNRTPKTKNTLDKLHEILKEYVKEGGMDFTPKAIGIVSEEKGGPKYETLKAVKNKDTYQRLIEAWAVHAGTNRKKPISNSKAGKVPRDYELLNQIKDLTLRAVFGQIIAEKNSFRKGIRKKKIKMVGPMGFEPTTYRCLQSWS